MALKPDRLIVETDISFFCNTVSNRGKILVFDTTAGGGSGAAMDNPNAQVKVPGVTGTDGVTVSAASGTLPAGLLLNDVVNKDLTQLHINVHKDEIQVGGKVTILTKGWVVTNNVSGSPTVGAKAYYNDLGELTPSTLGNGSIQVGKFLSKLDTDGYAKVEINV